MDLWDERKAPRPDRGEGQWRRPRSVFRHVDLPDAWTERHLLPCPKGETNPRDDGESQERKRRVYGDGKSIAAWFTRRRRWGFVFYSRRLRDIPSDVAE